MSSGFVQRFKGKIKAEVLWLGGGGIVDAKSGIAAQPVSVQKLALPVTAVANTDFVVSAPAGKTLLRATVYTETAYTAVTDAKIEIGVSAGDASYVAATSIKAVGIVPLTLVGAEAAPLASLPAPPNLFVRVVQSGGSTAVGNAILVLEYA